MMQGMLSLLPLSVLGLGLIQRDGRGLECAEGADVAHKMYGGLHGKMSHPGALGAPVRRGHGGRRKAECAPLEVDPIHAGPLFGGGQRLRSALPVDSDASKCVGVEG